MEFLIVAGINMLFDLHDAAANTANSARNNISSNVITLPVIATSDISRDTINQYAKSMEVIYAFMIKSIVEGANRSRFDSDIKTIYNQLPVRTALDQSWFSSFMSGLTFGLFSSNKGSTDKAVLAFAESAIQRLQFEASQGREIYAGGEAIEAIYNESRSAVPTFVSCDIPIANLGRTVTKTITVGIKCITRVFDPHEMEAFLTGANARYIVPTKEEKMSLNIMKIRASLLEKRLKANKSYVDADKEGKVMKTMMKVKGLPKPFVNILMSEEVRTRLTEKNMNLRDANTYSKLFSKFPITSLGIINTDIDVLEYSVGPQINFNRCTIEDFNSDVSKYEKELRSIIKFNKYS